jgi:CubicO group peptidase (beta-lactamase class C family)
MALSERLKAIFAAAVERGVTPGGVLAAGDSEHSDLLVPFGRTHRQPAGVGDEVTAETIYDIASLTKPVATQAVFLRLAGAGRIALDTPAGSLLPELVAPGGDRITVAHLLGHSAGFPDYIEFFRRLWAGDSAAPPGSPRAPARQFRRDLTTGGGTGSRDALVRMAGATPLVSAPGSVARYSDLGYILLGAALERAGAARLDVLARRLVFEPLGMERTYFVDLAGPRALPPGPVAPTEICPRRGLVQGEVHDENAHAGGGIAGHAGLFSTAVDLARFARAVLAAFAGAPGVLPRALSHRLATTPSAPGSTWRLGWDTPSTSPGVSHAGDLWPRRGFGHLGFTGCSLWFDPDRARFVALVTNRVHPTRTGTGTGIRELRREVMDAIASEPRLA